MKRFVIITSYIEGNIGDFFEFLWDDFIICADGGFKHALAAGINPNIIIGDFDSLGMPIPAGIDFIRLPEEKDDTDTVVCAQHALSQGAEEIIILGGMGGRLDHTIGNLQLAAHISNQGKKASLVDGKNIVTLLKDGKLTIQRRAGFKLSLLSFSEICRGVNIKGVFYPLENASLTNKYPIGVSNEFTSDFAEISVSQGTLLVVLSKD